MREAKEPLHKPLHFDKFSLAPDACSYVSKVWKTSVIELTSERNKVVSSAYCEILTVPCECEKPLMRGFMRIWVGRISAVRMYKGIERAQP